MVSGKTDRSRPVTVKYWTFAGILLTDWCPARCRACYLNLPDGGEAFMPADTALRIWSQLVEASPHGCRIHLTGGEPFGRWPLLLEVMQRARAENLGPLEKVETNGYWAENESLVRERLKELDGAGMGKLAISTDPFHQQYIPIRKVRLLAKIAEEILGGDRLQVRWRDWLKSGYDTAEMDERHREELFVEWLSRGRDRLSGRAAESLAGKLQLVAPDRLAGDCRQRLLRNRHVHVSPGGDVWPGVCAGITIGKLDDKLDVTGVWNRLVRDHEERPVLGRLVTEGPAGLLSLAESCGFSPATGYAGKCHLCWDVRKHLWKTGEFSDELGPAYMYR